jgi:hypothetical protein
MGIDPQNAAQLKINERFALTVLVIQESESDEHESRPKINIRQRTADAMRTGAYFMWQGLFLVKEAPKVK